MSDTGKRSIPFKVSARMMRMFGRQNVSNPLVAVIELIKNAYDADAGSVMVTFTKTSVGEGTIIISDNGSGMDEDALTNRWMMIGTDYKEREPISPGGRVRTGAKGIGRFALDRLGDVGILETFQSEDADGLRLTIDWRQYDSSERSFESIVHELETIPNTQKIQGTTITISQLRDRWSKDDYNELYDDLVFLIPPLDNYQANFSINLYIDDCLELSGTVQPLVRAAALYELSSRMSADGSICHTLTSHSGKEVVKEMVWSDIDPQLKLFEVGPACGPIKATILFYLRDARGVNKFDYKVTDIRRYLNTFRGIRLYRDGFQIKPYGSRGNDWLGLDGRKQRSPEGIGQALGAYHVSNNQIIGTVTVSRQTNPKLEDRTSREGLIENSAFSDLKKFLMNGLEFLEMERQLQAKHVEEDGNNNSLEEAVEALEAVVEKIQSAPIVSNSVLTRPPMEDTTEPFQLEDTTQTLPIQEPPPLTPILPDQKNLPSETRPPINSIPPSTNAMVQQPEVTKLMVSQIDVQALEQSTNQLKIVTEAQLQEIQLLRALATIGIALATFAHEINESVLSVLDQTALLNDIILELPPETREEALERLNIAHTSAQRIANWSTFILQRVKKNRRTEQVINFATLISTVLKPFESTFSHRFIVVDIQVDDNIPPFRAFPIDYEAIMINLVTNAVKALEGKASRKIKLHAMYRPILRKLEIIFEDNGPGIQIQNLPQPQIGVQQIFEPFVSGKHNEGTGMGLAVVNRIVKDLRGSIKAKEHGELGGAQFTIELPLKVEETVI